MANQGVAGELLGVADSWQGVAMVGKGWREAFLVPKAHPPPFHGLLGIYCRLNLNTFE